MKLKEVIVVEGKHDSDTLQKYFDCDTIETQGSHLSKATIQLLKEVHKTRGIIVFCDPDYPGEQIRQKINLAISNAKHAFIMKEKARTSKKVGIEHASKEALEEALANVITYDENDSESITLEEIMDLGLNGQPNSALLRERLGATLHIGKCNAKTLWKRLNMLQISKQQVERILQAYE